MEEVERLDKENLRLQELIPVCDAEEVRTLDENGGIEPVSGKLCCHC